MKAVILAGGRGTRLGPLTRDLPKPLLEIGGVPVIEHQIRLLVRHGFRDILVLSGFRGELLEERLGDGSRLGARVEFLREPAPLGTAGAIREAEARLDGDFLVLFGDVMIEMDLGAFARFHRDRGSSCTVAVHPNDHPADSDLVDLDESGRVTEVFPKPHAPGRYYPNLVAAGAYAMSHEALAHVDRGKAQDLGRDILARLARSLPVYGYRTSEYLKDMGTPERLEQVRRDFASGRIARSHRAHARQAVFLDRDGVINEEKNPVCRPEELELIPGAADAIRALGRSELLSVVVTNQPAVAKGLCTLETLREVHRKLETLLGREGAKLDAIYFCPHHPEKGHAGEVPELKIACRCRKPATGMIERARAELHIEASGSWLVGDSARDILCGKSAGLRTIGVQTGNACRDLGNGPEELPDFVVSDLRAAVDVILDRGPDLAPVLAALGSRKSARPSVVAVAGNSRAGKSTLAARLARRLRDSGRRALVVALDHWILAASARPEGATVLERFQLPRLESDLQRLLRGERLELSPYDPALRGPDTARKAALQWRGEDVVILEGVVALASEPLRELSHVKVFCEIGEEALRARFMRFYRRKGLSEPEAYELFESRRRDEYRLIARDAAHADVVLRMPDEGETE